jgi:hypothetical protein
MNCSRADKHRACAVEATIEGEVLQVTTED